MNNKGQVLPIFVILFPIIILIVTYIVDIGLMYTEKRKIENTTYDAINYYFEKQDTEKTLNILKRNIKNGEFNIKVEDNYIIINVNKKHKGIYSVININKDINVTYKGNLTNRRIIKG